MSKVDNNVCIGPGNCVIPPVHSSEIVLVALEDGSLALDYVVAIQGHPVPPVWYLNGGRVIAWSPLPEHPHRVARYSCVSRNN